MDEHNRGLFIRAGPPPATPRPATAIHIGSIPAASAVCAAAAISTAATASGGAEPGAGDVFENVVVQEIPAPLASTTPGGAQGTGHGSAGLPRTPSGVERDIPQYTWEPAMVCKQEVVLEDERGDNTASLTRAGAASLANCSGFGFTAQGADLIVRGKGGGGVSVQAGYNWWNPGFTPEGHTWADILIQQEFDDETRWIYSKLVRKGSGKPGGNRKGNAKGSPNRSRSRSPPRGPPGPDGTSGL